MDPKRQARRAERARKRRAGRVKRWLITTAFILGVTALAVGGWAVAWRTDLLVIKQVEVVGADGKLREAVQDAASVPIGDPLVDVDTALIQDRVEELEWVRSATVRADWPDGVVIDVDVRQGIGQDWATGEAVDSDGTVFTLPGVSVAGLPVVRVSEDGRSAALRTLELLPADLLQRITMVTASTRDDIRLTLKSGAVVRWGSADQVALKAEVLAALLGRRALVYDVSSPMTPTTTGERTRNP